MCQTDYKRLPGTKRQYQNIHTGDIISRYQYDKMFREYRGPASILTTPQQLYKYLGYSQYRPGVYASGDFYDSQVYLHFGNRKSSISKNREEFANAKNRLHVKTGISGNRVKVESSLYKKLSKFYEAIETRRDNFNKANKRSSYRWFTSQKFVFIGDTSKETKILKTTLTMSSLTSQTYEILQQVAKFNSEGYSLLYIVVDNQIMKVNSNPPSDLKTGHGSGKNNPIEDYYDVPPKGAPKPVVESFPEEVMFFDFQPTETSSEDYGDEVFFFE